VRVAAGGAALRMLGVTHIDVEFGVSPGRIGSCHRISVGITRRTVAVAERDRSDQLYDMVPSAMAPRRNEGRSTSWSTRSTAPSGGRCPTSTATRQPVAD
jgi:hypothetical protein